MIDRMSQLEQSEQAVLLRALLTVFDRADCRGRALASQELPSLLAQAGFDAARCSPALLEDALTFCCSCHFFDSFETQHAKDKIRFFAKGLTPFGRWRADGKTALTFGGFHHRIILFTLVIWGSFLLFSRLL